MAVYVAHLASVRVGTSGFTSDQRNDTIKALGRQIADEKLAGVIVMGDFNGTANDRSLAPLTAGLRSAQGAAGYGLRVHLAGQVPDGADRPHHGARRHPDQGLGDELDRQRPPPGRRRGAGLAVGDALAVGVALLSATIPSSARATYGRAVIKPVPATNTSRPPPRRGSPRLVGGQE